MKFKNIVKNLVVVILSSLYTTSLLAAGDVIIMPRQQWSWAGWSGVFDKSSLQRGLQVYKEVCSTCHGMELVSFRQLSELGYNNDEIKSFAKEFTILDGPNKDAEIFERAAVPSDYIPAPYINEEAAREANGGAYPLDLSLIVKSRAVGRHNLVENFIDALTAQGAASGADYIYALLTGYVDPPEGVNVPDGMYYNAYFIGNQIAMPSPLSDGGVEYAISAGQSSQPASIEQQAYDVANFLSWSAQRELETRHQMGVKVLLFLIFFAVILYFVKKRIWSRVNH